MWLRAELVTDMPSSVYFHAIKQVRPLQNITDLIREVNTDNYPAVSIVSSLLLGLQVLHHCRYDSWRQLRL